LRYTCEMTVWGETDSLLQSRDRFINVTNFTQRFKPTTEGGSEVIEMHRLVRVIIWGGMDGLLLSSDRFIKIDKVIKTLKPTKEGVSEVIEIWMLVG
jgi:hypothetical protein